MWRIFERLTSFAVAMNALLCVAACVLWVRSYRHVDYWWARDGWMTHRELTSWDGRFRYFRRTGYPVEPAHWGISTERHFPYLPMQPPRTWYGKLGFSYGDYGFTTVWMSTGAGDCYASVPHWFIAFLAGIAPAIWLVHRIHRRRRRGEGFCPVCGYDLRATPDRCSECGTQFAREAG